VAPLRALVSAGHDVALVVTRGARRRGRNAAPTPSPVAVAAATLGLPVSETVEDALAVGAELGVVVAFGRLIKPAVLVSLPMVNLHFSLLPRWRGAAPVERAILAGDRETGVCLMAVEEGLDTGGVYAMTRVAITDEDTAEALRARLVSVGSAMLVSKLSDGLVGLGSPVPQKGEPTYAAKVSVEDLHLDWNRPAVELTRLPRVGKAWTTFRGQRLLVVRAQAVGAPALPVGQAVPGTLHGVVVATALGGLELEQVQPQGRAVQAASAWRNGARPAPGERLGQ
jgi:methionyl-tRNA formyltransferase